MFVIADLLFATSNFFKDSHMWSDNDTSVDLLGFQHLSSAVTSIVKSPHLLPASIGVFGDWGSGKTSLLKMVEEELKKENDDGTLVLWFNGWMFEGFEDAKTALMGTILDEIGSKRSLTEKGKALLKKLAKRVNWFRVAGTGLKYLASFALAGPLGLGVAAAGDIQAAQVKSDEKGSVDLGDVKDYLKEESGQEVRKAVREFRKDFEEMLEATKIKRLVVIIDDLDRCLPDTIIETLEAIKLFLFVKNSAFVIGADERLVQYAVRRRFPELPGENVEVGRDYLEKLVQYPVRLPPLDGGEMETYINLLFTSVPGLDETFHTKAREKAFGAGTPLGVGARFNYGIAKELFTNLPPQLDARLDLSQRIAPALAYGLSGNPRQCKRFLNTLMMRLGMAKSRAVTLDESVLAKLMLLEHFRPPYFRRIAELQFAQEGRPQQLQIMESSVLQTDRKLDLSAADAKKAGGKTKAEEQTPPVVDAEFLPWIADEWVNGWLRAMPKLSSVDLRPYFFFSRDKVGSLAGSVRRLSPRAQQLLQDLLHDSEAKRNLAIKDAKSISSGDASGVFDALSERLVLEAEIGGDNSILLPFLGFVDAREELKNLAIAVFARIPESRIPISLPPKLMTSLGKGQSATALRALLERWKANTSNANLARAANSILERM